MPGSKAHFKKDKLNMSNSKRSENISGPTAALDTQQIGKLEGQTEGG